MNILLISPPSFNVTQKVMGFSSPPLNLAYLASMVCTDHRVKILDASIEGFNMQDVIKYIKHNDPDLIGFTGTTTMMPDIYRLSVLCKEYNKDIKIALGGHHVSFMPEYTFNECSSIDFIIRGEGELTFSELVNALEKKHALSQIKGLSFRYDHTVKNNPDRGFVENVDSLPSPAYDLLSMDKYRKNNVNFSSILSSRGCPFHCVFCSSSSQLGHKWRAHCVDRIMNELKILYEKYGKDEFEFVDDTFTVSKKRVLDLTKRIRQEGLDISWVASSRVDTFSKEIGTAMKKSGAHTVYFGIESGSEETLRFIGKGITLEKAKDSVSTAHKTGLKTIGTFVFGFPNETKEDIKKTLSFSRKIGLDIAQFTIATPYPGTRLWDYAQKKNLISTFDWSKYSTLEPIMKLEHFSTQAIEKIFRHAYFRFYLRPSILIKDFLKNNKFIISSAIKLIRSSSNLQ